MQQSQTDSEVSSVSYPKRPSRVRTKKGWHDISSTKRRGLCYPGTGSDYRQGIGDKQRQPSEAIGLVQIKAWLV